MNLGRVEKLSENFSKDIKMKIENIKKNQSEIKDTVIEMKKYISRNQQ